VNFRLVYDGPLKAASQSDTRRIEKHAIRLSLSKQLDELYQLKDSQFLDKGKKWEDMPVSRHSGLIFLALVRERLNLVCDLDILFLRREDPGRIIGGGGDLDNRIKTLFDALRVPTEDEARGLAAPDSALVICLTEDDKLITGFRVTTDRLLEPAPTEAEKNHVRLIINVEVKATKLTPANMAYFSHF
jgi:hypothetical protein